MHFAIYNLETKLIPFNPDLYSNTQPHRPKPNPHWKKALNLLHKTSIPSDHLPKLTFKSLYLLLLKPDPIPLPREIDIPQTNGNNQANPYTWLRLTLFKPRPSLFSNFEKEITLRTAYKGYAWGCFFQKHNFTPKTPNDFLCKLCFSSLDDPQHLFFDCPPTKYLVYSLESFLSEILKKPISLSKNILLYNFSEQTGNHNLILSKMASLIRLSSFQLRNKIISFNLSVTPSLLNEELYKIKTKFKSFLKKAYPDLSK